MNSPGKRGAEGLIGGEACDGGVMVCPPRGEGKARSNPHPLAILQGFCLHRGPRADGLPLTVVHPLDLQVDGRECRWNVMDGF